MSKFLLLLCMLGLTLSTPASAEFLASSQEPLRAEQAFILSASAANDELIFDFTIAPGTYLYQKAFVFETTEAQLGEPLFPEATYINDPYYGNTKIYRKQVHITVPVLAMQQRSIQVKVDYQGCSDQGFCYPPQSENLTLTLPITSGNATPQDGAMNLLQDQPIALALLSFLVLDYYWPSHHAYYP